jgi:hypothetical protein
MYYKTEVKVVVLSSKPLEFNSIDHLGCMMNQGDVIGDCLEIKERIINVGPARKLCVKLNSDPKFLETL